MLPQFKAPSAENAVDTRKLYRDTRTTIQQLTDLLKIPIILSGTLLMLGIIPFIHAEYAFITPPIAAWIYLIQANRAKKISLPFKMPKSSNRTDYNDPTPGRRGFAKASGVFYIGRVLGDLRSELWLGASDMLTHMLVFGTTGSGKTETLVSLAFNTMAMGSGLFYVDPKGSPKLIGQLNVMARICGRDDDFRCINYLTEEKALAGTKMPLRTSNTTNPLAYGNAESLSNMLNSLIPKSEGSNAIFSANARNLMKSIMYALVELRDRGEIQLSSKVIRDHLTLAVVLKLAERNDLSKNATDALRAFLTSVGWQEGKDEKSQPKSLAEQFGYARSYFGEPLNILTDTYGHIYGTAFGEVDMRDVVLNRRILVIVIPSLNMAPDEVKSLGVISLSSIRIACSVGLGTGKEGVFSDALFSLPTDAPSPFLSITDEYAAIPTPGYVEILTQGRGLGISAIVASQDQAGIAKADKDAAQQILENTKTKLFMKMTAAGETFDVAKGLAGEVTVMESGGMGIKPESASMFMDYRDNLTAQTKERQAIHLKDLQDQGMGEFHGFYGSRMVRGDTFYANPPLDENMQIRYNHLVTIYPPEPRDIEIRFGDTPKIVKAIHEKFNKLPKNSSIEQQEHAVINQYNEIVKGFGGEPGAPKFAEKLREVFDKPLGNPMDTAIAALVNYVKSTHLENQQVEQDLDSFFDQLSDQDTPYFNDTPNDIETQEGTDDPFDFPSEEYTADFDEAKSISDILKLRAKASEGVGVTSSSMREDMIDIEKHIIKKHTNTDDDTLIKTATHQADNAIKTVMSANEAIIKNYPKPPTPKNNKDTEDFLSNSIAMFLSNSKKK